MRDDFSLVTRMVGDSTFGEFRKAVRRINSKAPNYDDQVGAALAATANELMGRIEPCPFCVACTLDDFQGFVMEFIGRWLFHGHPQYRENAARDVFLPGRILFPVSAATSANDEKLRWLWAHEEAHRLLLASRHRGSFEVLYAAVLELAEGIPAPARLRAHGFQESNLREFLATALGDRTEPLEDWSEFWVRTSEPLIFAAADEISGFARPFVRPCWDSVLATAKKLRPELHADLLKAQMEADRVRAAAEIEAEADLAATRAHGFACCE